jgi:CHAT domain-containing protein/tetratricopeptide (TPR) repeat protein
VRVKLLSAVALAALALAVPAAHAGPVSAADTAERAAISDDPAAAIARWKAALAGTAKPGRQRAHILINYGTALVAAAQVEEAVPILREGLASPGITPGDKAHGTMLLGSALTGIEKIDEAEAALKDAVAQWRALEPQGSAEEAEAIHTLSITYYVRGDLDSAARYEQESFDLSRKVKAPENAQYVAMVATMAMVALQAGRPEAAETYAREAMTVAGRVLPEDHPTTLIAINNWATVLNAQNRRSETIDILRRIAAIEEKSFGKDYPGLAVTYNNLGRVLGLLGRYDEAVPQSRRAVALGEKTLPPNAPNLAAFRNNLAENLANMGQVDEAIAIRRKALAELGDANPVREMSLRASLGKALLATGDNAGAGEQFAIIDAWQARSLPETHPDRIDTAGARALLAARAKAPDADAKLGQVLDITEREMFANADPDRRTSSIAAHLGRLLEASWLVGDRGAGFRTAQLMALDDAGRAITAVSARAAAKDGGAAALIRKRQDLLAQRDKATQASLRAYGQGAADYRSATAEVGKVDAELAQTEAALAAAQPDYAALTRFTALDEAAVAKRLRPDQALVMPVPFAGGALTFVVRRDGADWARSGEGATTLADAAALRASLGLGDREVRGALADAPIERPAFDSALAHKLYRDVVPASLDRRLAGAKSWVLAPGGGFTNLPFAVLVTEPPKADASLRATPWLIRKAALMQVPAIAGIGEADASRVGGARFVGIGAPLLTGKARPGAVRGFYRGASVNRDALAALAPLPQAERELTLMQAALGLKPSLLVGAAATESAVKAQDLKDVGVLAFATHGLIGGVLDSGSEPGLVMTPPATPSPIDDGLLTASEIAGLDIDADWVVLSACDTAAGESPSSPALSGLARAFLYAGARSLLVSHWAVRDDVAARLTVETASRTAKGEDRSQALRKAMLRLIDDPRVADGADPSVWAPFILVER